MEQVTPTQAVAFRLFLVVLVASTVVPLVMYAMAKHDQALAATRAMQHKQSWSGFYESCEQAKETVGPRAVCQQAERHSELSALHFRAADRHEEDAGLLLRVLQILPPALVLLYYTLRWVITGRLRPFWTLHARPQQPPNRPRAAS